MTPEQKQHAIALVKAWDKTAYGMHADAMAALLQELVDAPEPEPFGYFKAEPFGWTDCAETDDGAIALFAAPPAPSVPDGWKHDCAGIMQNDVELWLDSCPHCGKPKTDAAPTPADVLIATNPAQISSLAAPAPEPVARVTGYYAGYLSIATVDGRVLPAGTALYLAPPAPSVPDWIDANTRPASYVPVICKLEDGQERIGRWSDGGYWQFAEFLHLDKNQRNKFPPIEQRDNKVVAWMGIYTAPTPAEAPADVARGGVASEPVGYLYTNLQSGEYHVSDADDDYRGPERVLWCIEPVYRRAKGQQA